LKLRSSFLSVQKIGNLTLAFLLHTCIVNDIFVADGLSEGDKVRLARVVRKLRQVDVASLARVNPCEVTAIEKNRFIRKASRERILLTLGLIENETESNESD
jgi:hypothetical protein